MKRLLCCPCGKEFFRFPSQIVGKSSFCSRACSQADGKTLKERFEEKFIPEPNSGCWIWIAGLACGYGAFKAMGEQRAHRVSYRIHKGDIPEGTEIDHLCEMKCCVNPDHLEAVSHRENIFRTRNGAVSKNWHKTHCVNGHALEGENVALRKHGITEKSRVCRSCERAHGRLKYERRMGRA